jgi:hypothetical protein
MSIPEEEPQPSPTPYAGGPRTPEGKARSRCNALKHGLRAKLVLPKEFQEALDRRSQDLVGEFGPRTVYETFLVGDIARGTLRVERCGELGLIEAQRRIDCAELCWDDNRRAEAETSAAKLHQNPSQTVWTLRLTRQGKELLIERWSGLAEALRQNGGWTEDQRALALDLLGTPPELRDVGWPIPRTADVATLTKLVERQLDELRSTCADAATELDKCDRERALMGLPVVAERGAATLQRLEAECRRDLRKALEEFRRVHAVTAPEEPSPTEAQLLMPREDRDAEIEAPDPPPAMASDCATAPPLPPIRPAPPARSVPPVAVPARTATPAPAPAPTAAQPAATNGTPRPTNHRPASPSPTAEPPPLNRRARRMLERRAREAARRQVKALVPR